MLVVGIDGTEQSALGSSIADGAGVGLQMEVESIVFRVGLLIQRVFIPEDIDEIIVVRPIVSQQTMVKTVAEYPTNQAST